MGIYVHKIQFSISLTDVGLWVWVCVLGAMFLCHYMILLVRICERHTKAQTVDVTVLPRRLTRAVKCQKIRDKDLLYTIMNNQLWNDSNGI